MTPSGAGGLTPPGGFPKHCKGVFVFLELAFYQLVLLADTSANSYMPKTGVPAFAR